MASRIFFFIALLCTAKGNPLGQTTVCETSGLLSSLIPGYGTTICETAQNIPRMPYGLGGYGTLGGHTNTICETTPNLYGLGYGLPYASIAAPVGTATVCETAPNLLGINYGLPCPMGNTVCESTNCHGLGGLGLGYNGLVGLGGAYPLNLPFGRGYPLPYAGRGLSATVCETSPNVLGYLPGSPSTTVCETNPNVLGMGYHPGLGFGLGAGLGASPAGSTTVCESAPNVPHMGYGIPYPRPFL